MKVLVTGGSGVVGKAAVDHLLEHGHEVRLLSRHADHDARQWERGVEPFPGDVSTDEGVRGAADGCGVVLHVAGIVAEHPPEVTFEGVNVEGTRRLVREAARAGADGFIYVSSLGAERGKSDYHRSKKAAEEVVRAEFGGRWMVLRPGNVYGPGDEVISLLLRMVRTLPAVPVVGGGDQPFQPMWVDDLGEALARAVEDSGPWGQTLDLAGPETTTTSELLDLLEEMTGRSPARLPVPELLAKLGTHAAEAVGVDLPVKEDQLIMLTEENVIPPGGVNALTEVFGVTPTPLREGLRLLAEEQPEQLSSDGVGGLERQRYWADIRGSRLSADEVFRLVREEFYTLPPAGLVEVGAETVGGTGLDEGETLTLALPLRGHIQVRCVEVAGGVATCVTLEGHPLSGVIRFMVEEPAPDTIRFEVRSYTRSADLIDRLGLAAGGSLAQSATWNAVVEAVVERSGGSTPAGVQETHETLDEEEARKVEAWVEEKVMRLHREENPEQAR